MGACLNTRFQFRERVRERESLVTLLFSSRGIAMELSKYLKSIQNGFTRQDI